MKVGGERFLGHPPLAPGFRVLVFLLMDTRMR